MEQRIREIIARVDLLADEDHEVAWSGPTNSEAIIAVEGVAGLIPYLFPNVLIHSGWGWIARPIHLIYSE